jgi:hypothetical protein
LTDYFVQYLAADAGAVMLDGTFGVAHPLTHGLGSPLCATWLHRVDD